MPGLQPTRRPNNVALLHVSQPTEGGVSRCLIDYVEHQVARGLSVAVACPSSGPLASEITDRGAAHVRWEASREPGRQAPTEIRSLGRIVRDLRPRIVHLHSSKAGLAGRLAIHGAFPTIFQPHCWSFQACTGLTRQAALAWERMAARWADVVVCVSRAEAHLGVAAGIRARYRVVVNGIDLSAWREASAEEKSAARKRLELGNEPLVVCVGRLQRQKGQDVLLEAWPEVLEHTPEATLVLVGDGPDRATIERRLASQARLIGHTERVSEWLAAADVVAIPSRWEAMPLTLLEAMARSRSVVASDVGGVRETLGRDSGAVVPVEDPHALARALVERIRDPALARAEGWSARQRVEQQRGLQQALEALDSVYEELLPDSLRSRLPPQAINPPGRQADPSDRNPPLPNAHGLGVLRTMRDTLAGQLPPRYETPWRAVFDASLEEVLVPGMDVLDVGAGRQPTLPSASRPPGCVYVGLDLSGTELASAAPGSYDREVVADVVQRIPELEEGFDLVLSWQVLEHVAPLRVTLDNLRSYLRPQGRLIAHFSGTFSVFGLLNRVLPFGATRWIVHRVLGRDPNSVFPAHYDQCWDSALQRLLQPWSDWRVVPRFLGASYFWFARPLQALYVGYEEWARRKPHRNLATHYLVVAVK